MFTATFLRFAPNFLMNPNPASSIAATLPSRFGDTMLQSTTSGHSNRSTSFSSAANKMMTSAGAGATTHGGQIDHLVVDASGLTSAALRLLKSEPQIERECSRIVLHNLSTLIKRLQPKKSLVVLMDGSEGVWKAARTRGKGQSRRSEERASRGPGSGLALAVESAILDALPERKFVANCPHVVFSGSCTPGSVETKAALWAAGAVKRKSENQMYAWSNHVEKLVKEEIQKASKNKNSSPQKPSSSGHHHHHHHHHHNIFLDSVFRGSENDRVAFVGPAEMYFHCMTSPFKRTMSISQSDKDYKSVESHSLLDWMTLTGSLSRKILVLPPSSSPSSSSLHSSNNNNNNNLSRLQQQQDHERIKEFESVILRRMSQEIAFLMLLSQGHGGYELNSCQQVSSLPDLLNAYFAVVLDEYVPENDVQQGDGEAKNSSADRKHKNNGTGNTNNNSNNNVNTFVKNDSWLLERDFALDEKNSILNNTSNFIQEQLLLSSAQQKQSPSSQSQTRNVINSITVNQDPVNQLVPDTFGLNMRVFKKILDNCKAKLAPPQTPIIGSVANSQMHQLAPDHFFSSKYFFSHQNRSVNQSLRAAPTNHVRFADAAAYLDAVLQIFHLIARGSAPDPNFYLPGGFVPPAAWQLHEFAVVLLSSSKNMMHESKKSGGFVLYPRDGAEDEVNLLRRLESQTEKNSGELKDPEGKVLEKRTKNLASSSSLLTAAEYGLLCAGSAKHFTDMAKLYVGQQVSSKFATRVAEETKSIPEALVQIRKLLKFSNPNNAQRALCISPSVCLVEVQGKSPEMERMLARIARDDEKARLAREAAAADAAAAAEAATTMESSASNGEPTSQFSVPTAPVKLSSVMASSSSSSSSHLHSASSSAKLKALRDQRSHWRMFPVELGS